MKARPSTNIHKWRPITILSDVYKTYAKAVATPLQSLPTSKVIHQSRAPKNSNTQITISSEKEIVILEQPNVLASREGSGGKYFWHLFGILPLYGVYRGHA